MKNRLVISLLAVAAVAILLSGGSTFGAFAAIPGTSAENAQGVVTLTTTETQMAERAGVSQPLRSLPVMTEQSGQGEPELSPLLPIPGKNEPVGGVVDTVVQKVLGPLVMPTPIANFEGMYNYWGGIPPDTIGDIGPNHYVQQVNVGLQVFSKTGASLAGPVSFNQIFTGLGGICAANNNGDPVVLYDQMADRWFISQFAFNSQSGPTWQCIAVTTSPDPTGTWYTYAFLSAAIGFDDYPHYGVWPDAYYMTANRFNAPGFAGANVAYERDRMLVGDPTARMVSFLLPGQGGALPTDFEGFTAPPANTPNFILYPTSFSAGTFNMYRFDADFDGTSTFTGPIPIVGVTPSDSDLCAAGREQCIDQPNTTARLEAISDRFMHRITYRNMGTHESLMVLHTVDGSGTGIAGQRWYEIRTPNAAPTVFQQGTFAPADGLHRWMGSIAMDRMGNIAAGYSVSSSTVFPSIRYAGRLVTDPPGQFSQGEETLFNGTGSEDFPAAPRWGDYSSINVDPLDDCTFWYTTEYFRTTGDRNWRTRIGSFRFPNCTGGPTPTAPVPTPTVCTITFSDVPPEHTFYANIRCLACRGIIGGYADGTFRPENNITRGQIAKMVSNAAGFQEPVSGQTYEDVTPLNTFYEFIERLSQRGHMGGYPCGIRETEPCNPPENRPYFRPNENATRGQLSKIVSNAAGFIEPVTGQFYTDVDESNPFYTEIMRLTNRGVMSGYPCGGPGEPCDTQNRPYFRWGNNVTRGQASKIVANTFFPNCDLTPVPTPTLVVGTATPTLCPGGIQATGVITGTDPTQNGRLNRDGIASVCGIQKTFPGAADAVPRHYDVYTMTNSSGVTQCVNVTITTNCGDNHLLSTAYLGSFDPNNLATNYLADMGRAGPVFSYAFSVPAGATYLVVVNEGAPNIGCENYGIRINTCPQGVLTPTATGTAAPTSTVTATPASCVPTYTVATATATMIPGGTNIGNACDDCSTLVTLPFPVAIYEGMFTTANLGSNGHIQFASNYQSFYDPMCMPIDVDPNFEYTLFVHYDDLRTDEPVPCSDCGIFTQTIGTAPNRQYVIRWKTTYFNHTGTAEFEVILNENSDTINVIYGPTDNAGLEATSGIQRLDTGTEFTQFSCNQAVLTNGLRVDYILSGCLTPYR